MIAMTTKYLIEVRDDKGKLDFKKELEVRKNHPFLFSKQYFTIDDLCYYMSFGQGRNNPGGPTQLLVFMKSIGATYRIKYW